MKPEKLFRAKQAPEPGLQGRDPSEQEKGSTLAEPSRSQAPVAAQS